MSWQHLNQPQGWIGVISLSLSLGPGTINDMGGQRHMLPVWPVSGELSPMGRFVTLLGLKVASKN